MLYDLEAKVTRSQQIIGTNELFVGISFATVGDLFQLSDVNQ